MASPPSTEALAEYEAATVGDVLVRVGTTLVSRVGGASGPLYGTALPGDRQGAWLAHSGRVLSSPPRLRAGLEALQKLGAAVPGDKTIVDAYVPALEALQKAVDAGGEPRHRHGRRGGRGAGRYAGHHPMQARKGRASYLGPRSVGHQDPGATSTWLIFRSLAEVAARAGVDG